MAAKLKNQCLLKKIQLIIITSLFVFGCFSSSLISVAQAFDSDFRPELKFPTNKASLWKESFPDNVFELFTIINKNENFHASDRELRKQQFQIETNFPNMGIRNDAPEKYLKLAVQVFSTLPKEHIAPLKTFVIKYDKKSARGLGGRSTIIINAKKGDLDMSNAEFVSVLIHEIGHLVDLGSLNSQTKQVASAFKDGTQIIWQDDPSTSYYNHNWTNELKQTKLSKTTDFASVYGMSDCFEDFAEMYNMYITHGREARFLTQTSIIYKSKYNFMKNAVFNGMEFETGDYDNIKKTRERYWDSTLIPFDVGELLP